MEIKSLVTSSITFTKNKIYHATKIKGGWYVLIDDSWEAYVFPPHLFEVIRNVSSIADIDKSVEERADGGGFWNKNLPQNDARTGRYLAKINPSNESFFLAHPFWEHPKGGYMRFDNKVGSVLQCAKLITGAKSIFHVEHQPDWVRAHILQEATRQMDVATPHEYRVEWLVSDESAAHQLKKLFETENLSITVCFFPE